jgi:hypothetical protein
MTVVLVQVKCRNFLKAIRGSYRPFVIKHALFPLGTTCLLVRCSDFVRGVCQNFRQNGQFFYHSILMPFHDIKQGFMYFWSFLKLLEFKSHGSQCLCPSRDTNMFENSFQFTAQGINSHTSTQIWFSNPWWFAVACTCSSNLNYGHYMARNSLNVLKRSNEP